MKYHILSLNKLKTHPLFGKQTFAHVHVLSGSKYRTLSLKTDYFNAFVLITFFSYDYTVEIF